MGVTLPSEVLREKREAVRGLLAARGVAAAGVFGSVARRGDTTDSDIDLIVRFQDGTSRDVIGLEIALEELTGVPVDIADFDSVWERAHRTGVGASILAETVPL